MIKADYRFFFTFLGASSAESAQVYVDLRALRNNRVALVERGAPNSLCLIESGKHERKTFAFNFRKIFRLCR